MSSMFREAFTYLTACLQSSYEFSRVNHDRVIVNKVSQKAKIMNQYNHVTHLTQDIVWESDKYTRKHQIQESQEVSPFPAGDYKAA